MVGWRPGELVPAQLGDAFAALYDWFEPRHAADADNGAWGDKCDSQRVYKRLERAVERASTDTPSAIGIYINSEVVRADNGGGSDLGIALAVYFSLRAIDRGTVRQNPLQIREWGGGRRAGLLDHYLVHARFNTDPTDGYVLPKWTGQCFRGTIFADDFVNLVRARVDRGYVRVLGRGGSRSRSRRKYSLVENPRVVIVPTLYEFFDNDSGIGEASFQGLTLRNGHYFRLDHAPSAHENLQSRLRASVQAIHDSDAAIAIYPELVLNQDLLATLQGALGEADRDRGNRSSALDWVVVGVGLPTEAGAEWPSVNACWVLDRSGKPVSTSRDEWKQKKRHRYKLSIDEQVIYGVEHCFPELASREEAIERGDCLYVFEDRGRRFAVLVCEDLANEEQTLDLVRQMMCSSVITIVMDGPVSEYRWAGSRSKEFAARTGGLAIVANSLLLPNLPKVREDQEKRAREKNSNNKNFEWKDPYPTGEQPVGLLVVPHPDANSTIEQFCARATPNPDDSTSLRSNLREIPLLIFPELN